MDKKEKKPLKKPVLLAPWQEKMHEVIFEADTPSGKLFDVALLVLIFASILSVMLESVQEIAEAYATWFFVAEWIFTALFTIEYILRLICVAKPLKYATSFFGIIDLLAIIPTYISIIIPNAQYLMVVRAMRLLRVFRIFKLAKFIKESSTIMSALRASQTKITVFITFVMMMVIILGSVIYVIEGGQNSGFTSIPRSVYWAIVTLTTVGYGDIAPVTATGQFLAAVVMILGYGVIAVPTGIVSAEMVKGGNDPKEYTNISCRSCSQEGHDPDAFYCKYCGERLD